MSARIAPEPIRSGMGSAADYRSRAASYDQQTSAEPEAEQQFQAQSPAQQQLLAKTPPPPPPPGAAFAVALISGQLPPRPRTERELQLRLGSADLPAQGSLALHDRFV